MQFDTTYTLDECRKYLNGHAYEIPVLASTEVKVDTNRYDRYDFNVQRVWKGMNGALRYTVLETKGTLKRGDNQKTTVSTQTRIHTMGFVLIAFAIILFFVGFSGSSVNPVGVIGGFLLLMLFIIDIYVLYRIVGELKN